MPVRLVTSSIEFSWMNTDKSLLLARPLELDAARVKERCFSLSSACGERRVVVIVSGDAYFGGLRRGAGKVVGASELQQRDDARYARVRRTTRL
jgi:hypothetical protein